MEAVFVVLRVEVAMFVCLTILLAWRDHDEEYIELRPSLRRAVDVRRVCGIMTAALAAGALTTTMLFCQNSRVWITVVEVLGIIFGGAFSQFFWIGRTMRRACDSEQAMRILEGETSWE